MFFNKGKLPYLQKNSKPDIKNKVFYNIFFAKIHLKRLFHEMDLAFDDMHGQF